MTFEESKKLYRNHEAKLACLEAIEERIPWTTYFMGSIPSNWQHQLGVMGKASLKEAVDRGQPRMEYIHIKQLAERLEISPRAIRFYEEKGLIRPTKDDANSYRMFTEQDAWRLQTILLLRETGMSLKDIRSVLNAMGQNGKDTVVNYLELQRSALYAQWIELSYAIQRTEQVVETYQQTWSLEDDSIRTLVGNLKRLREARESSHAQWNFDDRAGTFDKQVTVATHPWSIYSGYTLALDAVVDYVEPKAGEQGLELAIGTGNLAEKCVTKGAHMSGVDQSFEMLRQCRKKHPHIQTKLGNLLAAPFYSSLFDFVVSSYAFHLLTNEQQLLALREVDRLLRPDGRLCIADHMFLNQEHREAQIEKLSESGDTKALQAIELHHFADQSRLKVWLMDRGYETKSLQLTESVHLLFAQKIKGP